MTRRRLAWIAAVAAPLVLGAVLYPARQHLAAANLALLFVVCTVAVAGLGWRGAGVTAALVSGLSFDFFCTKPYLSLRITHSGDLTSALLLLVVGLVVGELAVRARRAEHAAAAGAQRLHRLHDVGERIASGEDPDLVVIAVAHELRDLLGLRDCRFTTSTDLGTGARIEPDGEVTIGGRRWDSEHLGLPTREVALAVRSASGLRGTFLLTPTPALPVDRDRCLAAVALADQLGPVLPPPRPSRPGRA